MIDAFEREMEKTISRKSRPKLTDTERHKRFVDMAHEVKAEEGPEAFDRAFDRVANRAKNDSSPSRD